MPSKHANADRQRSRKVVVVAFDGAKLMDISGPVQVFSEARLADGRAAYRVILASEAGGAVATDTGVKLDTVRLDSGVLRSVDTLLVAGGDFRPPPATTGPLCARLAKHVDRPRRLGSEKQRRTGHTASSFSVSTRPSS
jgi:transcriptional regulator GlxA family with amidase domain